MRTVTAKSHFKKITDKSSNRFGEKRPDLQWSFRGLETQDFHEMSENDLDKVATLANAQLEAYGRKLILANNDDWDFDPSERISLDAVYDDITSVTTRKRKVTKETLAKCGEFYATYAGELLGKNDKAANAGAKVIAARLQPIVVNPEALAIMRDNILALIDKASDASDSDIRLSEKLEENADCLEWIVAECEELITASKIDLADSL